MFKRFIRRTPSFVFDRVWRLPTPDQEVTRLVVRIPNAMVDPEGLSGDINKYRRRQPVVITNLENGKSVIRFVYGVGATIKGFEGITSIALDYEAFIRLGIRKKKWRQKVQLRMVPAWPWQVWGYYWNHPDYGTRFQTRMTWIALIGGLLGLLFSLIPLI